MVQDMELLIVVFAGSAMLLTMAGLILVLRRRIGGASFDIRLERGPQSSFGNPGIDERVPPPSLPAPAHRISGRARPRLPGPRGSLPICARS